MTCIACEGFPSRENDPCGLCGKSSHIFRGGLKEIVKLNGVRYAVTGNGVLKFTGGRWRDAVLSLDDLMRKIK